MKKLILIFGVLGLVLINAQGILFQDKKFQDLISLAKKENKIVFIDAYAEWCGPCKKMAKDVFTLKEVGDFYNKNFINAKFDMEKGEGKNIAASYKVRAYPTYLFVDGNGNLVHRVLGQIEPSEFIRAGQEALVPDTQSVSLKQQFENGESSPEFLLKYFKSVMHSDVEMAIKIARKYTDQKKDKNYSKEDFMMLVSSITSPSDVYFEKYKKDKAEIITLISANVYENQLRGMVGQSVFKKSFDANSKTLNEKAFLEEAKKYISQDDADGLLLYVKLNLAKQKKDSAFEKLALEYYKDATKFSSEELNMVAWYFFENVSDKTSLAKAIEWAKQSIKTEESYENSDTLANLFNKIGDKKNAKIWAKKAIDLAKKSGDDDTSTQDLLKNLK